MSTKLNIPLSSITRKLQAALTESVSERGRLQVKIADALNDITTPLDKASEALATLRARDDINNARLSKHRPALLASFVADVRAVRDEAEKVFSKANEAWSDARAEYRIELERQHKENEIKRLIEDPALTPKSIRAARKRLDEARAALRDIEALRGQVDKEHAEIGAATRAASVTGESYIKPVEWFIKNASAYIPELGDGEAPKAGAGGSVIGKAEVFRI
jgi:hypothetical protein